MKETMKGLIPHLLALVVFVVLALTYCSPVLQNKTLPQSDQIHSKGATQLAKTFEKEHGERTLWNTNMFSGMPYYLYAAPNRNNIFYQLDYGVRRLLNHIVAYFILFLVCNYLLFIFLGVNPWLSMAGAIALTFSTYNIAIIEAGHGFKIYALTYAPLVIAGTLLTYRRKYIPGVLVFLVGMGFQIKANHYQITYYLFLVLLIFVIIEFVHAIRSKKVRTFVLASGLLLVASLLAVSTATSKLWTTYEYTDVSIRGANELDSKAATSGLDRDYALAWSYGVWETFTILIPGFSGGSSQETLGENSALAEDLKRKGARLPAGFKAPLYWGKMPFTGAPFYFGAAICFLFLLGCFLIDGRFKWWVVAACLLGVALSWGKNFGILTDLFLNWMPFYNKFRAVSTTLIIPQILMPLLGIMAVDQIFKGMHSKQKVLRALKWSAGISAGICLFFILFGPALFDFSGLSDARYKEAGFNIGALVDDRISYLRSDAIRSIFFIALALITVGISQFKPLWVKWLPLALVVIVLVDLWQVDRRYLGTEDFVRPRAIQANFERTEADIQILKDNDPHFRVLNLATDPFNDAKTSYFHRSIGGYHGAKMRRYQDVIERYLSGSPNQNVLDMLDTKYLILSDGKKERAQIRNTRAGGAWFVSNIQNMGSAEQALNGLGELDFRNTALVEPSHQAYLNGLNLQADPTARITGEEYIANKAVYNTNSTREQLAVFSDIYYNDGMGWQAYIDGKEVPHIRVNYLLRALKIPAGEHKIEFKFYPKAYYLGETISLIASVIVILLLAVGLFFVFRKGADPA